MTKLWIEGKTNGRFPTRSTVSWESRKGGEIPTFPQLRRLLSHAQKTGEQKTEGKEGAGSTSLRARCYPHQTARRQKSEVNQPAARPLRWPLRAELPQGLFLGGRVRPRPASELHGRQSGVAWPLACQTKCPRWVQTSPNPSNCIQHLVCPHPFYIIWLNMQICDFGHRSLLPHRLKRDARRFMNLPAVALVSMDGLAKPLASAGSCCRAPGRLSNPAVVNLDQGINHRNQSPCPRLAQTFMP